MSIESNGADDALARKQKLFEELDDALRSEDEETPDPGRLSSVQAMQKAAARGRDRSTSASRLTKTTLSRSVSDTSLLSKAHPIEHSRPQSQRLVASENSDDTGHAFSESAGAPVLNPMSSSSNPSKTTGKRKRESSVKQIPNERQIFRGLRFYFFPNSDKHPARRMRIGKAIDFGATWEKEFNEHVTHVIVDKSVDFSLLKKFLRIDSMPSNIIVVSENYPAECISFKTLLEPRQKQFKVKGNETSLSSKEASSAADRSLQLKPADKSVQARSAETPPADERTATTLPLTTSSDTLDNESTEAARVDAKPEVAVSSTEEFDAVIKQARELQHLPLDNEDEPVSRPSSSGGPTSEDEHSGSGHTLLKQRKTKLQQMQDKFQCMQKHTGSSETPNAATIVILQQMADYYDQVGDDWRMRAYRKAIATLRNHSTKVWTKEEALALPQIGERLATKIEEIAFTNRLRRLDNAKAEPHDQVLQTFMKVYGAGFAQASKWVNAGYTSLDELLAKAELTENQRIGIEHYADFNSRIPRVEVEQHGNIIRKTLQQIDPTFEVIVGGSYRRGSESSGDIDCIITRPETSIAHVRQVVLDQLVPKLFAKKFLVAELAATSREDGSKWHGASCIPSSRSGSEANPWRRIDLLLVPSDELGAALIYFTGNDIFNRSLRLLASTKGMRLNQRGLYKDVIRGKGREKISDGSLVEGKDEKKIFAVLGVPWRPPEHRIC